MRRATPVHTEPPAIRTVSSVRKSLAARPSIRAIEAAARECGEEVWIVGGILRDAFLGIPSKDIDVACAARSSSLLSERIARRVHGRTLTVGRAPRRIIKIVSKGPEIDLWEIDDPSSKDDLYRRDFTINSFRYSLPGHVLESASGALDDLAAGVLRPPRPGVLTEDPVRVLRAARFIAHFPWFRISPRATAELGAAARLLPGCAPERRLVELDRLLPVAGTEAASALRWLESWSALGTLLPGATSRQRLAGRRLVELSSIRDASFLRALLLLPVGPARALQIQEEWRVPRKEKELAEHLFALDFSSDSSWSRRGNLVRLIRLARPFVSESLEFLRLKGRPGDLPLFESAARIARNRSRLARILSPPRLVPVERLFEATHLPPGPLRSRLVEEVDAAVAAGEIRSARAVFALSTTVAERLKAGN